MLFFRLYSKKTIFVGKDSSMDDKWKALEKYNLWGGNTYQLGLERKSYTDKIGNFVGNNLVKVLIGQRRSGKSYILRQIASSLVSERGVNPANILYINKEYLEFDFIDDYKALESLYRFYREKLKPQGKVYLFFDEIQKSGKFTGKHFRVRTADKQFTLFDKVLRMGVYKPFPAIHILNFIYSPIVMLNIYS